MPKYFATIILCNFALLASLLAYFHSTSIYSYVFASKFQWNFHGCISKSSLYLQFEFIGQSSNEDQVSPRKLLFLNQESDNWISREVINVFFRLSFICNNYNKNNNKSNAIKSFERMLFLLMKTLADKENYCMDRKSLKY